MDVDVHNMVVGGSAMQTSEDEGVKGGCLKHTCSEANRQSVMKEQRNGMDQRR